MNTSEIIYPLPPRTPAQYDNALPDNTLDETCIRAQLTEIIRRGLCDLHSEPYYDGTVDDSDEILLEDASRALHALALEGMISLNDFVYDDDTHTITHITPSR